ncbi:MAG: ATP-binding cassette domain-containing protein, partial [Minisyncoccia bacterium]
MSRDEVILRFENLSFEYEQNKPILAEVNFSVRRNTKITIMGQNGGGKSTMFGLITKALKPEEGNVIITNNLTIA